MAASGPGKGRRKGGGSHEGSAVLVCREGGSEGVRGVRGVRERWGRPLTRLGGDDAQFSNTNFYFYNFLRLKLS